MFKQKKLKALLKTNPTLYDILRSDLCTYFVKGVGKSKKEILPYMLQERMVLDMIDCIAVKGIFQCLFCIKSVFISLIVQSYSQTQLTYATMLL